MTHLIPALALGLLLATPAVAAPPAEGTSDRELMKGHEDWITRQVSPSNGSCCSEADGRFLQESEIRHRKDGSYEVYSRKNIGLTAIISGLSFQRVLYCKLCPRLISRSFGSITGPYSAWRYQDQCSMTSPRIPFWPANDARLRELWATGMSVSQIGVELGCGKNSVSGRSHRLKLPPRPNFIGNPKAARAYMDAHIDAVRAGRKPVPVPVIVPVAAKAVLLPKKVTAKHMQCRWPMWGWTKATQNERPGKPPQFCTADRWGGDPSYCAEHQHWAYVNRRDDLALMVKIAEAA